MEIRTINSLEMGLDLDSELDQVGVILDHPIICGNCMTEMQQLQKNIFRCSHCGMAYEDRESI